MLCVYQKSIFTPVFQMMMTIWNFLVMIYSADHPSSTKRGGVSIYYRNSLPLKIRNIQYLHECINFEIGIGGKLCRVLSLYDSPSQSQDDFESLANNFELNIDTATANNTFFNCCSG